MKTTMKKTDGAVKRSGKFSHFQRLVPKCGRFIAFEAKELFSLAPAPLAPSPSSLPRLGVRAIPRPIGGAHGPVGGLPTADRPTFQRSAT